MEAKSQFPNNKPSSHPSAVLTPASAANFFLRQHDYVTTVVPLTSARVNYQTSLQAGVGFTAARTPDIKPIP
jgi:hypothetical protein